MSRIFYLARAEVLHIIRDRTTVAQILIMPIIQLLVLTNAATFVIRNTPACIIDHDRTSSSRGLTSRFAASGHFDIVGGSVSAEEANEMLLDGKVTMVMTIPREFEASLIRDGNATVQVILNAEKGSAAGIVQSYAARILSEYSVELGSTLRPGTLTISRESGEGRPARGIPNLEVRTRYRYNAALNYKHYMVPGILVALVTMIGTLLAAQNIAREKELGTLEQLNVTPITRSQFIAAKLLPLWALGLITFALGLTVGKLAFGIPIRGSLLLLFVAASIYLVVALAIGLFVSAIVETQQQAMFVTFFITNIYLLLSGLFTPIDSMSPWVKVVSQANPVRHFVAISRAILVKGAGLTEVARPLTILLVFAVLMLGLATRQYRKRTA